MPVEIFCLMLMSSLDIIHDIQIPHIAIFRDKIDMTEKNVADVVVKKLAELDASKNMMEQYRQSVEVSTNI